MIIFALQLKTQPQFLCIRQFLLLLAVCAVGCKDSGDRVSDRGQSPAAVIASMDSVGGADVVTDGQYVGGIQLPDIAGETFADQIQNANSPQQPTSPLPSPPQHLSNPTLPPEIQEVMQRIQLLRGSEVQATGAAMLDIRRRRNFRIIDLATRTLPLTMSSNGDEATFLQLVRYLLEARLELAVSGNADDIQSLYADVKALSNRDPDSAATAEGVYTLARFAHEMARREGRKQPVWFDNFSQWSREFARRFPDQQHRATVLLLGSARSCELQSLEVADPDQSDLLQALALQNYRQLVSDFADSEEAVEATAVLRRLSLPGQKLSQFSGQTLNATTVDCQSFVEVVTVVYFWDRDDPEFTEQLMPLLQQAADVANGQLQFVGVPLNDDVVAVREFLQRHYLPGEQIVGLEDGHRGWDHPLVRFWGLSRGATCWLIDRDGKVAAIDVTAGDLVQQMKRLFTGPDNQ